MAVADRSTKHSTGFSALDRFLGRSVPLWLVVAIVLLMTLGAVGFAWFVKRAGETDDQTQLARAAIAIAAFPTDVKEVLWEIGRILSGEPDYSAIRAYLPGPVPDNFLPVRSKLTSVGDGLLVRQGPATPARGWRVIAGVFQIKGSLQNAAVLLSPNLEIVHSWPLVEDAAIDAAYQPPLRKVPHGLAVLSDGSVIYSFDNGRSLHRKDKCGRTIWAMPGRYHHSVMLDDTESTVWVHRTDVTGDPGQNMRFVQVATADGKILREFSVADIVVANPEIDILELRRDHPPDKEGNAAGLAGKWRDDAVHPNDIDPLPQRLADKFPMFSAGDLLMSARDLNLLFVIDPATLKVKWRDVGSTIRQHDPDWLSDGSLSVLNNRMSRGYSEITTIDPATGATTVAVDGKDIGFYTRRRGSHEPLPGGGWLIASTQQGRIIEVAPDGRVALDFYNRLPGDPPAYSVLPVALFFSEGALNTEDFQCDKD